MFDFPKFALDHHVPFITEGHHHCHQGWVQLHCHTCGDGRSGWHLGWSQDRGNLNCWRCGPVKVIDYIKTALRVATEEAYRIRGLYTLKGAPQARKKGSERRQVVEPPGLGLLLPRHLRYLRERGLKARHVANLWNLQGTRHLSGMWSWRVVAPIYTEEGKVAAYIGRSIVADVKPKYRMTDDANCSEDPKSLLYGIHRCEGDSVIVVEGPGDVWNMGPGTVATLGIDWKQAQANKLRRFKKRFLLFDPEDKAQEKAEQLAECLSLFGGETEIISGLPSDPGSLPAPLVRKLRRKLLGE